MTSTERDKTVDDWTEVLYGVVPYENLYPCYLTAIRKHTEGPFRAGQIIAEWNGAKAKLPVIQTECLFCSRLMEDPSAPGSCVGDPNLPNTCPFHGASANATNNVH